MKLPVHTYGFAFCKNWQYTIGNPSCGITSEYLPGTIIVPGRRPRLPFYGRNQYVSNIIMPSRHRLDIKGSGLFFVTTTVKSRFRVFKLKQPALEVIKQLAETSAFMKVSIVAYVLMPSHLHALVGLEDSSLLSKYIQSFKSLSARRVKNLGSDDFKDQFYTGGKFILWQPRFDDVLVFGEKQFKIKMEYIHNNPVKAGLVSRAEDFPFSSARDWLGDGKGLIEVDKGFGWLSGI